MWYIYNYICIFFFRLFLLLHVPRFTNKNCEYYTNKNKNIVLNSLHVVYMWLNKKQTYQTARQNSLHIDMNKIVNDSNE